MCNMPYAPLRTFWPCSFANILRIHYWWENPESIEFEQFSRSRHSYEAVWAWVAQQCCPARSWDQLAFVFSAIPECRGIRSPPRRQLVIDATDVLATRTLTLHRASFVMTTSPAWAGQKELRGMKQTPPKPKLLHWSVSDRLVFFPRWGELRGLVHFRLGQQFKQHLRLCASFRWPGPWKLTDFRFDSSLLFEVQFAAWIDLKNGNPNSVIITTIVVSYNSSDDDSIRTCMTALFRGSSIFSGQSAPLLAPGTQRSRETRIFTSRQPTLLNSATSALSPNP